MIFHGWERFLLIGHDSGPCTWLGRVAAPLSQPEVDPTRFMEKVLRHNRESRGDVASNSCYPLPSPKSADKEAAKKNRG